MFKVFINLKHKFKFFSFRYELDGICGLNFVLESSLGGGGVASLRSDPQGKAYGQMLLDFVIEDMPDIAEITG